MGTTVLEIVFDFISIVGFFMKLSRYSTVSYILAVIIARFLKVIQFILLNLLLFGKTGGLWDILDIFLDISEYNVI